MVEIALAVQVDHADEPHKLKDALATIGLPLEERSEKGMYLYESG